MAQSITLTENLLSRPGRARCYGATEERPIRLEQYFIKDINPIRDILSQFVLGGRHVLEIGAGTGMLTNAILEQSPTSVTAFEIEPGLCKVQNSKLTLIEGDVLSVDLDRFNWDCFISNPPYSLLPQIARMLYEHAIEDYLIMTPESRNWEAFFPGSKLVLVVPGIAFEPIARGNHYILQRGFQ